MASDTREKDWGHISDLYCSLLEDTAEKVRKMTTIPIAGTRNELIARLDKINRTGRTLKDYMEPPPESPYDFSQFEPKP